MHDFPLTREEWYWQRDDRTRRIGGITGFDSYSVGVVVDERVAWSYDIQVMTITALNILSRWCRKIRVQIPEDSVSCLPLTKGQNLQSLIQETVLSSDPFNDFSFAKSMGPECDQLLIIGAPPGDLENPHVWIAGAGWISGMGVGTTPLEIPRTLESNPVGPSFSACLGVAELFRSACGVPTTRPYMNWYSLLDFSASEEMPQIQNPLPFPNQLDLGRVFQIGCGAVGSSLDFFLSLTTWKGVIDLIDYDFVTTNNCNRSLSYRAEDAVDSSKKTEACSRVLRGSSMLTESFNVDYSEFISQGNYLKVPPDLVLCLANEKNIWEVIQQNLPPMVFHATTSPNWTLNFGRHIPSKEWCILCRFSQESLPKFSPVCAQGFLPTNIKGAQPVLGVLPFLSPAAAIIILSELAKTGSTKYPLNENFVQFSMKQCGSEFLRMVRGPVSGCVCRQQRLTHYSDEIKSTKLWHLSESPQSH